MVEVNSKKKFRPRKLAPEGMTYCRQPPEGGYGYLIAIGLAIPSACCLGNLSSFGLIYNDFLVSIGAGTSAITMIMAVLASAISFSGLFTSFFIKNFSTRSIGIFGAVIYTFGSFLTIFATSVEYLIISFGVLQGFGVGLMFTVGYTCFNQYFMKRRIFMMTIAQLIKGIGSTTYPILAQFLMERFGFRGTLVIISAIHSHTIFAMVLMHPIEWHLKEVLVPINESEQWASESERNVEIKVKAECKRSSFDLEKNEQDEEEENDERFDYPVSKRIASLLSLNNLNGGAVSLQENSKSMRSGRWRQKLVHFLDLDLLKDIVYINIVLGITFTTHSDITFFTLLPMYLFELEFTKADAAFIISVGAAADFSSRICLAVLSFFVQLNPRHIFLSSTVIMLFIRFIFLNMYDFMGIAITIAAMGFFRTWIQATVALIFADHLPHDRFASGYGLFLFLSGNLTFLLGPIVGLIRDLTQSYVICFHSLSFLLCLCAVSWIIEILWSRIYPQKIIK